MRYDAPLGLIRQPACDLFGFFVFILEDQDGRRRSIEYGNGIASILAVAVDVVDFGAKQSICLRTDLMRRSIIDPQRFGPTADINTQRLPGEWFLKDPLSEVPGKKQSVRMIGTQSREEP